ncbi:intracellular protein transport protein USO1-like protein [Aphelenchoides avenae]|nr:intracellular protein transport protein USO1-like protein [Aphelenchus avenae]
MNNGAQASTQQPVAGPSKASVPKTPRSPKASKPPPLNVEVKAKCIICTMPFLINNVTVGTCGHPFHMGCLSRWLRDHQTCPTCRKPMLGRTVPVYFDKLDTTPQVEEGSAAEALLRLRKQVQDDEAALESAKKATEAEKATVKAQKKQVTGLQAENKKLAKEMRAKDKEIEAHKKAVAAQSGDAEPLEKESKPARKRAREESDDEQNKTDDVVAATVSRPSGSKSAKVRKTTAPQSVKKPPAESAAPPATSGMRRSSRRANAPQKQ